ncbi:MAG: hypoxanthine phosphoribosyltransferase [Bacillota bacterium]
MNKENLGKIVLTEDEIQERIKALATRINNDYQDKNPILVSILKSSVYFLADLTRQLTIPLNIDFLGIERFATADKKGQIHIEKNLELNISERHILIIDAIINTGLTHSYLLKHLKPRHPASLAICTLIENTEKRLVNLPIEYQGFQFEKTDIFVVGYGLDYKENYRHLPYIVEYKKS